MSDLEEVRKLPCVPTRDRDSHKGDFGSVLAVGCSPGMTGAGCMVARGAQRAGAGLVTLALPEDLNHAAETKLTSAMTLPLPETDDGMLGHEACQQLLDISPNFDLAAVGPGLGRDRETEEMVQRLMAEMELPAVLDADGLNAVAGHLECIERRDKATVLTPHPGEMMRLCGADSVEEVQRNARETAVRLADRCGATIALKGHGTIVTDGSRYYTNHTGNPGMACGGSGDVLTGLTAGLICQGLSPFGATALGVFLHGLAGDLAAREMTELAMTPEDIMTFVPRAVSRLPTSDEPAGEEWFNPADVAAHVD